MSVQLLFWREAYRAASRCSADTAARRLQSLLSTTSRFSAEERLLGRVDGRRFRVWKRTLLGASADVVQLEGDIGQGPEGVVIEGSFSYKAATKIQFIGFFVLGLFIAVSGVFQRLAGATTSNDVIALGGGIAGLTALWIVGAYWMKHKQIDFLKSRMAEILEPEGP
ncbi:MAG TPA: hypothetical protein VLA41_10205 [Burkholderiales bacterium]|nr:hypothetical protein [Burkholderiales bacterium]